MTFCIGKSPLKDIRAISGQFCLQHTLLLHRDCRDTNPICQGNQPPAKWPFGIIIIMNRIEAPPSGWWLPSMRPQTGQRRGASFPFAGTPKPCKISRMWPMWNWTWNSPSPPIMAGKELKTQIPYAPFFRTTFGDAFYFLAPLPICFRSNASRRILIALSFWVWCRKGEFRLILYLTFLPALDPLIYPSETRSEIIFLTDLSVIPINPDISRPVINGCLARNKSTIAWFVRNVHVAIRMPPVIPSRIFMTPK